MDDVRLGWVVGNGISRGQRALQTQLKRAAATLTVVLHLFQFTVYADCAHTCTPVPPFAHSSFPLSPLFMLHLCSLPSQFFCLLTAFWGLSHVFLLLCFCYEICLPHGKLALFANFGGEEERVRKGAGAGTRSAVSGVATAIDIETLPGQDRSIG